MTREEAIAYGKECLLWNEFSREHAMYQFIEMAIKALSQEPCEDAISREDAIHDVIADLEAAIGCVKADLRRLPSVTQKSGKWIRNKDNCLYNQCSYCGASHCREDNFCPNCGAKMESEDKE